MKTTLAIAASAAVLIMPIAAQATIYSLADDFSNSVNPNSPWSFTLGSTPLTHFAQPTTANTLNYAAENGYWGTGADFFTTPTVIKTTQDGSGSYNTGDFLAGDVIMHSTNPNGGGELFINWTAPTDGVLSLSSLVWYAHSPVIRSNTVTLLLDGTELGSAITVPGVTRSTAASLNIASPQAVSAGDVLSFRVSRTDGQSFGSLTGLSATIDFTANAVTPGIPEPATWGMMLMGFGGLGAMLRRRRAALAVLG